MSTSRIHSALIVVAACLGACGGTVSDPNPNADPSEDAAIDASGDANGDHATTILCVFPNKTLALACGNWVSVDTIDYELVDGGKKFNHETPCSSGACVGTSCGVPDDAGVITELGSCETF